MYRQDYLCETLTQKDSILCDSLFAVSRDRFFRLLELPHIAHAQVIQLGEVLTLLILHKGRFVSWLIEGN